MEKKSQLLDELRLEVGSVREKVQTLASFYIEITRKLARRMSKQLSVSIYEATAGAFKMRVCAGTSYLNRVIPFGDNILSTVAIRGRLVFQMEGQLQKVFLPFYRSHHLLGILIFFVPQDTYEITDDDLAFIREIGRFIEVQHATFDAPA
ncbi:hypothetical protein M3212_00675 [Alkalihalobacillus oceani]|uniref:hypothetical protein n=1 Tax=Halalkalibacter oceani TaxID=1653776 RepID=UPI0020415120|nr:hypothetical protein [Halalkalibacter oceani]MCM3759290.1 hypothetical protein [Halalkalibacter oceani]